MGDEVSILQSRPITTLRTEAADEIVWTRGYSDDYWNDPVSPLFFELLGDHLTKYVNVELNEIMGYKSLESEKTRHLLRLHKAHAYFNLGAHSMGQCSLEQCGLEQRSLEQCGLE